MAVSGLQLSHFERVLFKCAVGLASLLVLARIGTMHLLIFLHRAG